MPNLHDYELESADRILTPALLIYADKVRHNIRTTIALLGGDASRWRPHVKTAKLGWVMRMLVEHGVTSFKCATSRELLVACESGARDVLVAYPHVGANAERIAEIARQWPDVRVSVLIEADEQIAAWAGSPVSLFIDINPGMDRTGIPEAHADRVCSLALKIVQSGLNFAGLHYYDGHIVHEDFEQRTIAAYRGYDHLVSLVEALGKSEVSVPELVCAGTPTFLCAHRYPGFQDLGARVSVSPGTVVFCDLIAMSQLSQACGYEYAVLVLTRVASRPRDGIVTCDAGHKAIPLDAGVPTCGVLGNESMQPRRPSEEHLPIAISGDAPAFGSLLYLIPRHVCPVVNLFDTAIVVEDSHAVRLESVSARGRETRCPCPHGRFR